jgi:hypothetical protein
LKKYRKAIILLSTITILMGLLSGCARPTPISVAKNVVEAMKNLKSVDGATEVDLKMTFPSNPVIGINGGDLGMKLNMDVQSILAPKPAIHSSGKLSMSGPIRIETDTESYSVKTDGGYMAYTLLAGKWMKLASNDKKLNMDTLAKKDVYQAIVDKKIKASLDDKLQKVGKKDAYLLKVTLKGEYIKELLSSLGDMAKDISNALDSNDININMDIYIYKDSSLPAKITADLGDLTDAMISGTDEENAAKIKEITLSMTVNSYNKVKPIQIPEEVKKNAIDIDELNPENIPSGEKGDAL